MARAERDSQLDDHRVTDVTKLRAMSSSFAEAKHMELDAFPAERAMLYKMQKMNDEIKELHRYLGTEVTANGFSYLKTTTDATAVTNTLGKLFGGASGTATNGNFAVAIGSAGVEFSSLEVGTYKLTLNLHYSATRPMELAVDTYVRTTRVHRDTVRATGSVGYATIFNIVTNNNAANTITFRVIGNTAGQSMTIKAGSSALLEKIS